MASIYKFKFINLFHYENDIERLNILLIDSLIDSFVHSFIRSFMCVCCNLFLYRSLVACVLIAEYFCMVVF